MNKPRSDAINKARERCLDAVNYVDKYNGEGRGHDARDMVYRTFDTLLRNLRKIEKDV